MQLPVRVILDIDFNGATKREPWGNQRTSGEAVGLLSSELSAFDFGAPPLQTPRTESVVVGVEQCH